MAMPEWAYFMQKVYANKSLGIDPKAEFQKPAELSNNPIYADQNFSAIVQEGSGSDSTDVRGNGNADDYGASPNVPVESDFDDPKEKEILNKEAKKPLGPANYVPVKKDSVKFKSRAPVHKETNKERRARRRMERANNDY